MSPSRGIVCGVSLWSLALLAEAIDIPSTPADRELSRQRQEQLLEDQAQKLEQLQTLPQTTPSHDVLTPDDSHCFTITAIELQGVSVLSESEKTALLARWLNTCMGISQINQLVKSVTNRYIEKGYITSRAYIPEQNLASGTLIILVVEGKTSAIEPQSDSQLTTQAIQFAFPDLVGDFLNLRDLEQGIDQLNRLPSNNAQLKLQPCAKPGETIVGIENQPDKPWRLSLGKHNTNRLF